jgi:V/A-type H+-transporting ATPase subunit E
MENLKSQLKFLRDIEAKEVIEKAEEQARKILQEAEEKAEKMRSQKMTEVSEKMKEKETAEVALTNLEGKKKISGIRFQLFEETLAKASAKLGELGASDKLAYKERLERLIIEAATRLKGNELEILTNAKDRKLVKERLKELERKLSKLKNAPVTLQLSEETPNMMGGAMVRTIDKRQIFNNTWEARMASLRQEMVDKVFAQLFAGVED